MNANWPQGNVLIVDDNVDFRMVARDLAKLAHCAAMTAASLREALKLARHHNFDRILIDLNLPGGNGLDLLDDIDLAAHDQCVVVTAHPTVATAMRAVRSPVVEYLLKPVETGEPEFGDSND